MEGRRGSRSPKIIYSRWTVYESHAPKIWAELQAAVLEKLAKSMILFCIHNSIRLKTYLHRKTQRGHYQPWMVTSPEPGAQHYDSSVGLSWQKMDQMRSTFQRRVSDVPQEACRIIPEDYLKGFAKRVQAVCDKDHSHSKYWLPSDKITCRSS